MAELLRHMPPPYDYGASIDVNFGRFFEWGLGLTRPYEQIIDAADRLGFPQRTHPLGFRALYLSRPAEGRLCVVSGIARVNIYPEGVEVGEDIHGHGFGFRSGNIKKKGVLLNRRYELTESVPDGEGYLGFETRSMFDGTNVVEQVTHGATIGVGQIALEEIESGVSYGMEPRKDFHRVETDGGAITIFCKTPTMPWQDGASLILKKPGQLPPRSY